MDLITADPTPAPAPASAASVPSSTAATQAPTALGKPSGEKRSKRSALMQIHSDTVSAAKAALHPVRTNIMPQKHQRKKVTLSLSLSLFQFSHGFCLVVETVCENWIWCLVYMSDSVYFSFCLITEEMFANLKTIWISLWNCSLSSESHSLFGSWETVRKFEMIFSSCPILSLSFCLIIEKMLRNLGNSDFIFKCVKFLSLSPPLCS